MGIACVGIVKWFNDAKGYGFIENRGKMLEKTKPLDKTPDKGKDVFVHYTAIQAKGFKALRGEQRVRFELVETDKGLQATNVTVIE